MTVEPPPPRVLLTAFLLSPFCAVGSASYGHVDEDVIKVGIKIHTRFNLRAFEKKSNF